MSKNLFLLCICCFTAFGCGETQHYIVDYDTNYYAYFSDKCYYKNPTSFEERIKKSPFDKMKKMEIVTTVGNTNEDILEKIRLTQKDIDTVSQVMNYTIEKTQIRKLPTGLKESDLGIPSGDCCIPRHALLFYDENDVIYLKWRICFECDCNRPNYIRNHEQYEALRLLFMRIGIKQFINPETFSE
jgi:hypothetical protein